MRFGQDGAVCFFSRSQEKKLRRAFTLVEMAIVLVIIGLIITTVFPALTAVRSSQQRSLTQNNLQALMRATAGYVQANGCLPCPTPASTTGNGFGRVRGVASASPAPCGTCPVDGVSGLVAEGIPPFISLGVPQSVARDGWGHWFTMRIDPLLAGGTAAFTVVTPPTAPQVCTCTLSGTVCKAPSTGCTCAAPVGSTCAQPFNVSMQGLCTASLHSLAAALPVQVYPAGASIATLNAVVFVSHGASGAGSFVASAAAYQSGINGCRLPFGSGSTSCLPAVSCTPGNNATAAACNAAGTNRFTDGIPGSGYDDLLAYADRNTLVGLPGGLTCQTVW